MNQKVLKKRGPKPGRGKIIPAKNVADIIKILSRHLSQQMLLYLVKNPQGISPEQLRLQLEATRKEYYTSIGELRRTGILIKRPPNKYYLSTFGRVLYRNVLVNIQKSLDVFWMIHSIDVLSSQDEVRKLLDDHNYRELLKTLIPNKEIRQTMFEELRKTMNDLEDGDFTIAGGNGGKGGGHGGTVDCTGETGECETTGNIFGNKGKVLLS